MRAEYLEARPGVSQADRQQVRDFDLYLKARHALIKNRHEVTRGRETGRKGANEDWVVWNLPTLSEARLVVHPPPSSQHGLLIGARHPARPDPRQYTSVTIPVAPG